MPRYNSLRHIVLEIRLALSLLLLLSLLPLPAISSSSAAEELTIAGDPVDIAVYSGSNQSAEPNTTLSVPLVARVTDAAGNPVAGIPVAWRVSRMPAAAIGQRFGGTTQKIAFSAERDGNYDIYTMNPDGSGETRLTTHPDIETMPSWSPDGTNLAFSARRNDKYGIYVINSDGTDQVLLTDHISNAHSPSWSPDGTKIAFSSDREGTSNIYIMNSDGTDQIRITNNIGSHYSIAWSPDGTKIAFTLLHIVPIIYVMNPDGTNQVAISNTLGNEWTSWSPDTQRIVFEDSEQIYIMDNNGTNRVQITDGPDTMPSWSPDGSQITFMSYRDNDSEIYLMQADGSGQIQLTTTPGLDWHPAWSPAISTTDANGLAQATFTLGNLVGSYDITATCVACVTTTSVTFSAIAGTTPTPPLNSLPIVAVDSTNVVVDEGQTATNSGTYSDPDADQDVTLTASVGTITKTGTNSGTWTWSLATTDGPDQSQTVTISANDDAGGTSSTTFSLTVDNVAPTVTLSGPTEVSEGGSATYSFFVGDPGQDSFTVTSTSCGANGTLLVGSVTTTGSGGSFQCSFPNGPVSSTVSVQVMDSDDATSNTATVAVTVNNMAPSNVNLAVNPATLNESQSTTLSGSFTDPGTQDAHTIVIEWGDGSANTTLNLGVGVLSFSVSHQYLDNPSGTASDSYVITVMVTDDADSGSGSASVTVNNVAPTITETTKNSVNPTSVTVAYSDTGTQDTHSCTIEWGDGSSTTVAGSDGICSATHTYSSGGSYTVQMTVTDDDGGLASASFQWTVSGGGPGGNPPPGLGGTNPGQGPPGGSGPPGQGNRP